MGDDTEVVVDSGFEPEDAREPILRRAPRIKEEEVHTIADQLLLEGHRPSVERIRVQLGRGSPNTIALFLDRWWSKLGARLRDLPGSELPPVPAEVASAMHALWTQAIDHARALLHETLAQQSAELTHQREHLQVRAAELLRERAELAREREALHHTVHMAQSQLEAANERTRADTARIAELENERTRAQALHEQEQREHNALRERFEAALKVHQADVRALNERMEAAERHWVREVDQARQALTAERKATHALERQLAADRETHATELKQVHAQLAGARAELVRAQDQGAHVAQQVTRLERTLSDQVQRADRAVQMLHEVQSSSARQIQALQDQLREATDQLKTVTAKLGGPSKRKP